MNTVYEQFFRGAAGMLDLKRERYAEFSESKIRMALYRPFDKRFLFYDPICNEEPRHFERVFREEDIPSQNRVLVVSDIGWRARTFSVLVTNLTPDLHLCASVDAHQCFPFYTYDDDGAERQENLADWVLEVFRRQYKDPKIAKWDIFYYVYGVLHHPGYREKFADNLKRELPRIPFAPDFRAFAEAGRELADLHVDYEKVEPYELEFVENPDLPLSYRVEKMRLSKDKHELKVNESLTLRGIPEKCFEYRLGNRSALDWVIDQYRVKEHKRSGIVSDPNRRDDEEYIVRLVGQVIRVSLETVRIVEGLPAEYSVE